jgi:anti-sigma factor RsiW
VTEFPGPVGEDDLMAHVDGRLSTERVETVRAYLAMNPEARERTSQYAEQRRTLRGAFGAQFVGPVPTRFRIAQLVTERRHRRYRRFAQIAAATCLIVLSSIGGWTAREVLSPFASPASAVVSGALITEAIAAHRTFSVEVRHPIEVVASEEADLVQWLSKRLRRALVVPDLTAAGFRLMGGRLLPAESGPAAQLMYEDGPVGRLTIYLRTGIADEEKLYRNDKGIGAYYWADEGLGCVIVGEAERNILRRAAESTYDQTFPDAPKGEFSSEPEKSG